MAACFADIFLLVRCRSCCVWVRVQSCPKNCESQANLLLRLEHEASTAPGATDVFQEEASALPVRYAVDLVAGVSARNAQIVRCLADFRKKQHEQ